jgi:putative ABC transport system substrate-binding protein
MAQAKGAGIARYAKESPEDMIVKKIKFLYLPFEPASYFEFIISLRTAKQIGLTIPPNVLARADRVIK